MARQDFIINENGELLTANGDLVISDSDMQHVEHIVIACPGEYKQFPMVGFGAILQINKNPNDLAFKRDLKIQLEYDGYPDPDIDLSGGYENLKINI